MNYIIVIALLCNIIMSMIEDIEQLYYFGRKLMIAILNRTFDEDEELKLEYLNAIDVKDAIY